MKLTEEEIINAQTTLSEYLVEHQDFNLVIDYLERTPPPDMDQLLIHRLKKRKLLLKDKMYQLERVISAKEEKAKA